MKKEFYVGQPLIVKNTGKRVICTYKDNSDVTPYLVIDDFGDDVWCDYHELEPSTEFKFSEIIAGLEQGYFEVETEFRVPNDIITMTVRQGNNGLLLERFGENLILTSKKINSTWQLVEPQKEMTLIEPRKKMTLEEIEAKLGYKIKLDVE